MGKSYTSEVISLPRVRLSFPELFKAKPFSPGGTPYYKASFLLDPADTRHQPVLAKIKAELAKMFAECNDGQPLTPDRICVKRGDTPSSGGKVYDGYEGKVVVSASNTVRPVVVNRSLAPVAEGDSECPYAGCWVNATVTFWFQNNQFGKRVNANLRGVQFLEDGPAFGVAPVNAEDEFEALGDAPKTGGAAPAVDFL